jgi:hypothetical protein
MSGGFADLTSPTFYPTTRLIASISKGSTTSITTVEDHGYITGMIVRVLVPTEIGPGTPGTSLAGMPQINGLYGTITVTGSDVFTIDIDSSDFDDFLIPGTWNPNVGKYPQVVPMGQTLLQPDSTLNGAQVRDILT